MASSSAAAPSSSNAGDSVASSVELLKPNLPDIGWKYNSLKDKNNTKKVTCDYCLLESNGGISRAKQHQMGVTGNVKACLKTPEDVKLILRASEEARLAKVKSVANEAQDDEETARLEEIGRLASGKRARTEMGSDLAAKKGKTKGPLDLMFFQKPEVTVGKGKQTNLKQFDKEAREKTNQYIARFFYLNGIAFNVAKSKSFKLMVQAIGQYGPHLDPPSYHELRNPCLNRELENTMQMLETNKAEAEKYGCSIMSDGWTDTKGRTLINFLINSPAGTMFIKSIDASSQVKTGKAIFDMLDEFVGEIGESRVVQLITDNGANYVLAGKVSTSLNYFTSSFYFVPCSHKHNLYR